MPSAIETPQDLPIKQEYDFLSTPLDTQVSVADDIERPPVSPITPTSSFADVNSSISPKQRYPYAPPPEDKFMERPAPLPINEDENFDMIALKSAMSSLEVQKLKARRDLLKLREIRDAAVENPERFKEDMRNGKLAYETRPQDALKTALEDGDDSDSESDAVGESQHATRKTTEKIPIPQDVVRCPPINWEKYHIVGASLDRMHEEQRKKPTPGQPWSEEREAVIAAPYDPLKDKPRLQAQQPTSQLPPPMETRRSYNRRKSGG